MKLSRQQLAYVVLYLVSVVSISIIIHEASHILTAWLLGVPFAELELGFYGINPSVIVPSGSVAPPG